MKFLGPIEITQRALVAATLSRVAASAKAFDISLRGLGAFPSASTAPNSCECAPPCTSW